MIPFHNSTKLWVLGTIKIIKVAHVIEPQTLVATLLFRLHVRKELRIGVLFRGGAVSPSSASILGARRTFPFRFLYHHQHATTISVRGIVNTIHNHHNPEIWMRELFSAATNIPASKIVYQQYLISDGSWYREILAILTAINVPGRNAIVTAAIAFMLVLSRFILEAICILLAASCCVTRLYTRAIVLSLRFL